jgi:hypothetical protein
MSIKKVFDNPTWNRIQKMIEDGKAESIARGTVHPFWTDDPRKLFPHEQNEHFDKELFIKRKLYLISVDFADSLTLPQEEQYDRLIYLSELDTLSKEYADKLERQEKAAKGELSTKNKTNHYPKEKYRKDWD